ncbi:hypothetical protein [Asanoa iriomotensis]|uniref:Lipoprotein n=1 Tax=Asanoa iriomotensis TaxID=234613 RepID=A0ABQ4C2P1_9ACTN|nr:hypothetical protein [Asanoa iriomotensis]GIF57043.1 hypothetical protein Air01nite_31380 [Asanoa iriomotensis]
MRRALVTLVLGLVALTAGACGSGSAPPPPPPPTTSSAGSAHTATLAVCAEAVKVSKAGGAAFADTLDELWVLGHADLDQKIIDSRSAAREQALRAAMDSWAKTLSALADQDVIPQVKAVLLDGARTVERFNDPANQTSDGEARTTLLRLAGKIEAACAA